MIPAARVVKGLWFKARREEVGEQTFRVRSAVRGRRAPNGARLWTCDVAMGSAGFCRTPVVLSETFITLAGTEVREPW